MKFKAPFKIFSDFRLYILLLLPIFFVLYAVRGSSLPSSPAGYHWKLVFSDEFNDNALNANKWTTCYDWYYPAYHGCSNDGNHELEWYTQNQVTVNNERSTLQAIKNPTVGWNGVYEQTYPYNSGMISTGRANGEDSPKWSTTYGYYVAKMKVTGGKGIWPAFWLLPVDRSWPPEIDIMEFTGEKLDEIKMTYHWKGSDGTPQKDETDYQGPDFTKDWHTYAVNWQPNHIDWYIDGVLRKSVSGAHVPDKPMELIINLAVGGDLPGNPDESTPFPAYVAIDYVRAYSQTKD